MYPQNEYEETLLFHLLLFFSVPLLFLLLFSLLLIDIKLQTIVYFIVAIFAISLQIALFKKRLSDGMTGIERGIPTAIRKRIRISKSPSHEHCSKGMRRWKVWML
jgi:membrane protein implicated in regulation of membrane protease activity